MSLPTERHPATQQMLKHFDFEHLRSSELKAVSRKFHGLAHELLPLLPDGPELTVCLRKLLEAKDCAVRAAVEVL